jgi:small GTP-binding protein
MIQKKICMVGVFGTGKTSLVQRYVFSLFLAKYHSTVGVKIDRKVVTVDGVEVNLLLWDVAGRDAHEDIPASYLRGAHGTLYVVDGTRRETFEQLDELREIVRSAAGDIPSVVALNKSDLTAEWKLTTADEQSLGARGYHGLRTSAKDGRGVEEAFGWLAKASLQAASNGE